MAFYVMKIGPFLAKIEPETLKKTHFGVKLVEEGSLLEGGFIGFLRYVDCQVGIFIGRISSSHTFRAVANGFASLSSKTMTEDHQLEP